MIVHWPWKSERSSRTSPKLSDCGRSIDRKAQICTKKHFAFTRCRSHRRGLRHCVDDCGCGGQNLIFRSNINAFESGNTLTPRPAENCNFPKGFLITPQFDYQLSRILQKPDNLANMYRLPQCLMINFCFFGEA